MLSKKVELLFTLYSFGNNLEIQLPGHGQNGGADGRIVIIPMQVRDE